MFEAGYVVHTATLLQVLMEGLKIHEGKEW